MKASYQEITEDVRSRNDILDVVGSHLKIVRAGSSYKGLCPFHKEKTPSFHVNPARQTFHCFGCGKGGDVFRFVMEMENVDFPTALRILARRAGITIAVSETEKRDRSRKDKLYDLHEQAAALFRRALSDAPEATAARDYLRERKLDGTVAETFGIGYAPARPDTLVRWAAKQNWPVETLAAGGLIYSDTDAGRTRDPTDRFQNRLMFPIWDETGRVIGFAGRVLRKEDHPAKYVNSPETLLFHKSRVLYALHLARRAIATEQCALLCEGQIDVIRCHTAGLAHAVAAQGTAVTEDHARILRRYTGEVVLLLDGDAAGEAAAYRTAGTLLAGGLHVRAVALPAGEDPDSFILKNGPEALRSMVREAPDAIRFVLDGFERRGHLTGTANLTQAARVAIELAARVPEAIPRELLLRQAAQKLGLPEDALKQDLSRMLKKAPVLRTPETPTPEKQERPAVIPPFELALIEHLLQYRDRAEVWECVRAYVPERLFEHPLARRMFALLLTRGPDPEWNPALEQPEDAEYSRLAARLSMMREKPLGHDVTPLDALRDIVLTLWRKSFEKRRKELAAQKHAGQDSRLDDEMDELRLQMAKLRQGWDAAVPVLDLHADDG